MADTNEIESLLHSLKERIEDARVREDHLGIIDSSEKILEVASKHPELRIAEFIFLRKIAKAYEKLGNNREALRYFQDSLKAAKGLEKGNPVDFSKEILALENRIKHLEIHRK